MEEEIKKIQVVKEDYTKTAYLCKDNIVTLMAKIRKIVDTIETKVDIKYWPIPTYIDLLFSM